MSILRNAIYVLLFLAAYVWILFIMAKLARSFWNSARFRPIRRAVEKVGNIVNRRVGRIMCICSESCFLSLLALLILIVSPFVISIVSWRVFSLLFQLFCMPKV